MVDLIFLGQLQNPALLAGVGMGTCIQNICGISIVIGLNNALETLASQAYGSKDLEICGVYLNRARFMLLIVFIPSFLILRQTEWILVLMGQNADVAYYS